MRAQKPCPFDKVVSVLLREPFSMSIAEVAQLTPYQVRWVVLRTDEDDDAAGCGKNSKPPSLSPRAALLLAARQKGMSDAEAEAFVAASLPPPKKPEDMTPAEARASVLRAIGKKV